MNEPNDVDIPDLKAIADEPKEPDPDGDRTRFIAKEEIGPILVLWSLSANRRRLQDLRAKVKKGLKKKWDGVVLHLRPGETIGSMKLPQTEALYEAIMSRFDPDLYQIRMSRKTSALAEHKAKEELKNNLTANAVADRLEMLKQAGELQAGAEILAASAQLEAAKSSGNLSG